MPIYEIIMLHYKEDDKYYISNTYLKLSIECGAAIKFSQIQNELDIYGRKDKLIDQYYEVFSFEYPDNTNLKIYEVEKPIVVYSLMEDIDCYISRDDYYKAIEKGAKVNLNDETKFCAPMISKDSVLYKLDDFFFPFGIDVRFKRISRYYVDEIGKPLNYKIN